jgi:hypothetical protein
MQMITEQQAIRERKYSDAEVERIIAANPPDKGFEGPPFYGDELVMPPEMTEKQMLEFLDTGRTESESNYLKYKKQLEMEGEKADDVTKDKAKAIPNVVVDAKKQQMKVNLDAYMRETLKSAKTPLHRTARIEMTPEDEALKKSLGKDFTNALKEMGLIDKATTSAKNKAIKDILYDIFNKMSKSDKYYSRTADEAWNRLIEAASQVEEMTRAPQFYNKDYMRYSAGMMRYLTTEERALMSLYTTNGASYISNASRLGRDSAEYKAMKKYLDVVDRLYEVTEQYVERKPVLLHRGVGVHDDWTDKMHPEKPTTLIDVFKNWKPGEKDTFKFDLPTSFSEDNEVARMFAEDSAIQHFNVGVTFNLVTNRSMPVSSVSIHRNEAEHIMRQGEKYRIVNVEKVNETYISWKVDIEHIGRDESVDYEFTLV